MLTHRIQIVKSWTFPLFIACVILILPAYSQASASEAKANFMCAGSAGFGLSCLDETGWQTFTRSNSPLDSDFIYGVTACTDGRMLIAQSQGIVAFDGSNWKDYGETDFTSPEAIACDAAGNIWVGHYQGVSTFDGRWKTYPASLLATGEAASDLVNDLVIGPDGLVWVVTSNSVARFDGNKWTVFQEGSGFDDNYFFEKVAIDSHGSVWVAHSWGLFKYDDATWTEYENFDVSGVQAMAVDNQDRIWIGTLTKGVFVFDGQTWSTYDRENSGLSSNDVNSIGLDAQGRLWFGTEYGVDIFDGTTWSAYRMENANLVDNDVSDLAVLGAGPTLPAPIEKAPGSITGQLAYEDDQPIANAVIEICVERLSSRFYGPTPCADQPFIRTTTTDAEGNFTLEALPVGRYILTAEPEAGRWVQLTSDPGLSLSERIRVEAGEETNLGSIIITAE